MTKQAKSQEDRVSLGLTLRSARNLVHLTMQQVADKLTADGYPTTKGAVQHWESGRNVPDAIIIKRLSLLYNKSADAILWENGPTHEAMKIAAMFDALKPLDQDRMKAMFLIFETTTSTDQEFERRMPITATLKRAKA